VRVALLGWLNRAKSSGGTRGADLTSFGGQSDRVQTSRDYLDLDLD
jgi:hypothetical protein